MDDILSVSNDKVVAVRLELSLTFSKVFHELKNLEK